MQSSRLTNFLTIAECGSISEAAPKLFLSQPTLSLQIKQLEEELGEPLFIRNGRSMELTTAGRIYADFARKTLSSMERTKLKLEALRNGMDEQLTIGIAQSSLIDDAARIMSILAQKHSNIQFSTIFYNLRHLVDKMKQGSVDVTFTRNLPKSADFKDNFEYVKYKEENVVLAVPDRSIFGDRESIFFREIDDQNVIIRIQHEQSFLRRCDAENISPRIRCVCGLTYLKVKLVQNGIGMAFFPSSCIKTLEDAGLKWYRLEDFKVNRSQYIIYLKDKKTAAIKSLIETVQNEGDNNII